MPTEEHPMYSFVLRRCDVCLMESLRSILAAFSRQRLQIRTRLTAQMPVKTPICVRRSMACFRGTWLAQPYYADPAKPSITVPSSSRHNVPFPADITELIAYPNTFQQRGSRS